MELILYILLFPLIVWNNLTWKKEHEDHWQTTRREHLCDTFDYEAWNRYQNELAEWWTTWLMLD